MISRAPHGARGLKFMKRYANGDVDACRAPHGARGLKYVAAVGDHRRHGRAPHGARGLKWTLNPVWEEAFKSRPARGAWIEI